MSRSFNKVFIPNRGVIAVRAIRTLREMGIRSVVGYSDCDRGSLAARLADESHLLGPSPCSTSYLDADRIVQVASKANCDAVFPGYGFLAENADFAEACAEAGITFIGPPARLIRQLGRKHSARRALEAAGFKVLPGTDAISTAAEVRSFGERVGYPLLIKPVAGAGGLGTVQVDGPRDIDTQLRSSQAMASIAFGDEAVCVEKKIDHAAAISIQFLADRHGHAIHLGEREGSVQRNYGKLVEEAPSLKLRPEVRAEVGGAVARAMSELGYVTAGTVEFLLDPDGEMVAIEVNPRIQVEHVVTEMAVQVDIIEQMVRTAAGEPLRLKQDDIAFHGHAVQCRIKAEDPQAGFAPSYGRVTHLFMPDAPHVRRDDGIFQGCDIPMYYDSLLLKVCAFGEDRSDAIRRLAANLSEFGILGVQTNLELHRRILEHHSFLDGTYDTTFVARYLPELLGHGGDADLEQSDIRRRSEASAWR